MMENIKEIPYGIANFVEVAEQNMYYVDKTMYLPLLEKQPRNLFFIRPRRFGKSIFLSMLRAYYDIAQKEKFQKRFGNLWIGSRPTPLQGKFQHGHTLRYPGRICLVCPSIRSGELSGHGCKAIVTHS